MVLLILAYFLLPFAVRGLMVARRPGWWLLAALTASVAVRGVCVWQSDAVYRELHTIFLHIDNPPRAFFELYFRPWFRLPPFVVGLALAWAFAVRGSVVARLTRTPTRRAG